MVEHLSRKVGQEFINEKENFEALCSVIGKVQDRYAEILAIRGRPNFGNRLNNQRLDELVPQVMQEVHQFLGVEKPVKDPKLSLFWLPSAVYRAGKDGCLVADLGIAGSLIAGITRVIAFNSSGTEILIGGALSIGVGTLAAGASFASNLKDSWKSSNYDPWGEKITIGDKRESVAVQILSHEYTHHLQRQIWGISRMLDTFWLAEGHARGVQQHVSHSFAEAAENPAYELLTLKMILPELKKAYVGACKSIGVRPAASLMNSRGGDRVLDPRVAMGHKTRGIGLAVFSIVEEKGGLDVYKDALKGDFSFLSK